MSVANVTLMDLDRDLSVLLDDSLAMLTWGLWPPLINLEIELLNRASCRLVKGLLLWFLVKHRNMARSHRPVLYDFVHLLHLFNHAFRRAPSQLGCNWAHRWPLLLLEVLLNSKGIVDIGVVGNHVLERSQASHVISPWLVIDVLKWLDILGPRWEVLNFFIVKGTFMLLFLWIFYSYLTTE